jgi:hypothetical protein
MKQLDCEIARLRSPRLIDVEQGADVQPDILKDLLKVDVPDIRKSVDRARDALKTMTLVAEAADDRRCIVPPSVEHSFGHVPQSPGANVRSILQRFRLFLWVQITKLDPRTWRI